MTESIKGVALVTGGGRGIGRSMVDTFLDAGYGVMTCGRGDRPADLADAVGWMQADVSDPAACADLVAATVERFGGLTTLINNAGVQVEKTVLESTDADWDAVMGINAKAVFQMCRAALPVMISAGAGAIINISSISSHVSDPQMALYNASKSFVNGLTRSIAVDHGPQGVRCNAICPGWIATDMLDAAFDLARDPAAARAESITRHALRRLGQTSDIAKTALWLAGPESGFITGQTITVDGGLTAASPINPGAF